MQTIPETEIPKIKQLYLDKQLSAREIAKQLHYSIDAVYYVMRKYNIARRSSQLTNQFRLERQPASFKLKSTLTKKDTLLLISGCMLYWAEGYKTEKSAGVDFANSDPAMQKLFIHFLRHICGITESRIKIQLYSYHNADTQAKIQYWSTLLHVPTSQFTKPYINPKSTLDKKGKMPYGLVHIRYYDKKLLRQIMSWIDEYQEKLW